MIDSTSDLVTRFEKELVITDSDERDMVGWYHKKSVDAKTLFVKLMKSLPKQDDSYHKILYAKVLGVEHFFMLCEISYNSDNSKPPLYSLPFVISQRIKRKTAEEDEHKKFKTLIKLAHMCTQTNAHKEESFYRTLNTEFRTLSRMKDSNKFVLSFLFFLLFCQDGYRHHHHK